APGARARAPGVRAGGGGGGRAAGGRAAWLQVEEDNEGARALYDGMGFAAHHRYHHYRSA
ncbi:GNAT family N-acetyltransferase, partial [Streptomyces anulatus]